MTYISFAVELTAQKKLERELQHSNQRLAESNEELERFTPYVVAHDLQAPLRTIASITERIADGAAREVSTPSLPSMSRGASRI